MAVRIGMGLGGFPFESIDAFRSWVALCEDSRIDSIWQSDRVVSKHPALEPMTLLAVVAGATQRLKLGTNAVVLPFRDPITYRAPVRDPRSPERGSAAARRRDRPWRCAGMGGDGPQSQGTGRPGGRGPRGDHKALGIRGGGFRGPVPFLEGRDDLSAPEAATAATLARRLIARRGAPHGSLRKRLARAPADPGRGGRDGRSDPPGESTDRTPDSRGPLRRDPALPFRRSPGPSRSGRSGRSRDATSARSGSRRSGAQRTCWLGSVEFRDVGITKFIAIPIARGASDVMEQTRRLDAEVLPHANDD